jgi:predicted Zn-dependent protease
VQIKDLEGAAEAARKAVDLDPGMVLPHLILGQVQMESGSFDEAEIHLREASSLDPQSPGAHQALGRLYLWQQKYSAAVDLFEQAAKLASQDSNVHLNLAVAYMGVGRLGDAVHEAFTVLRENPGDVAVYKIFARLPFVAFIQSHIVLRLGIALALFAPLFAPKPISVPYWLAIALYSFWINVMAFKSSNRLAAWMWTMVTVGWLVTPWLLGLF